MFSAHLSVCELFLVNRDHDSKSNVSNPIHRVQSSPFPPQGGVSHHILSYPIQPLFHHRHQLIPPFQIIRLSAQSLFLYFMHLLRGKGRHASIASASNVVCACYRMSVGYYVSLFYFLYSFQFSSKLLSQWSALYNINTNRLVSRNSHSHVLGS